MTTLARFASTAEQLGADSLWVGDRLLAAVQSDGGLCGRRHHPGAVPHQPGSVHRADGRRDRRPRRCGWAAACSSHLVSARPADPTADQYRRDQRRPAAARIRHRLVAGGVPGRRCTVRPARRTTRRNAGRARRAVDDEPGPARGRALVDPGIVGQPQAGAATTPADLSRSVHAAGFKRVGSAPTAGWRGCRCPAACTSTR